jgi:hypothetical protein
MADIIIRLRDGAIVPGQLLGYDVGPLFPDTGDQELNSWFALAVPGDRSPEEVVRELTRIPEVSSAYVKPPDSAP